LSLQETTLKGIFWSFLGYFLNLGINFAIGIILARLLSPSEFGLIGMTTIFISISELFVNSGFSQSLVRKNEIKEIDYYTVFIFNLIFSVFIFLIIFFAAPVVSTFYNEPVLTDVIRILATSIIINAVSIVYRVKLTKDFAFKSLNKIVVYSNIISGLLSIYFAFNGFGVWSLVFKTVSRDFAISLILVIYCKWKPKLLFSKESFKSLFGFGSNLLLSGFLSNIVNNLQYIIIGKMFSAKELGFFSRAELFKNLPSQNIECIVTSVSYPVLSKIQDEKIRLTNGFIKLFNSTVFLVCFLMIGTAVTAEPIIINFVGEKWRGSILYLQLLSAVGVLFPLLSININITNIFGRSDLYLRYQFISQILSIILIIIASFWGIEYIIISLIINSLVSYVIYAHVANKFVNYSLKNQAIYFSKIMMVTLFSWTVPIVMNFTSLNKNLVFLGAQFTIAFLVFVVICEIVKIEQYLDLKNLILKSFKQSIS